MQMPQNQRKAGGCLCLWGKAEREADVGDPAEGGAPVWSGGTEPRSPRPRWAAGCGPEELTVWTCTCLEGFSSLAYN